ncbi:MAG: cytochrome c-type biosis protein CcmH [Thermoleophilaceae bacterium]|nr:cytochrome c-type biosis protein CcmH [Thermoleophilaceae bacterium]
MKRATAALLCLVLAAFPAVAVAKCPQTTLAQIENQVICPVCGVPLSLATEAPQAQRERQFILDLIDQCKTEDQILDALVAQYGPTVLALPTAAGLGAAAYLVPIAGALLATLILLVIAIRWRRGRDAEGLDEAPANSGRDDADRLEAEELAASEDQVRLEADLRRYNL